jgi:hypothetical protein
MTPQQQQQAWMVLWQVLTTQAGLCMQMHC